jgi:hypothetical protein
MKVLLLILFIFTYTVSFSQCGKRDTLLIVGEHGIAKIVPSHNSAFKYYVRHINKDTTVEKERVAYRKCLVFKDIK